MQINLPKPDDNIKTAYRQLIADIDRAIAELVDQRYPDSLNCKPGCDSCCVPFSLLPLEAAIASEALAGTDVGASATPERCALLLDGLCSIYSARPIICRTQGLPIAYLDESGENLEVSACPLNFADDYSFCLADLLLLDQFNSRLIELNLSYCRSNGLEPTKRIPISALVSPG